MQKQFILSDNPPEKTPSETSTIFQELRIKSIHDYARVLAPGTMSSQCEFLGGRKIERLGLYLHEITIRQDNILDWTLKTCFQTWLDQSMTFIYCLNFLKLSLVPF